MNQEREEESRPSGENNRCNILRRQGRSDLKRTQQKHGRR